MALKKNLALMGITTVFRVGSGIFTFLVLARLLGPESFGVLMLWLSVAALLAMITNFGLTPYILREIGANPASAESIINEGLTGKILLAAVVFICAIVVVWGLGIERKQVFMCLLLALVADSFSEFFNAGFRARNRFDAETRLSIVVSIMHTAIVTGVVFIYPTVEAAAFAYAFSRILVLVVTVPVVAKYFIAPRLARFGVSLTRFRKTVSYAIDFGVQNLFGQIDSVVLNYFVGPVAVGFYQAGMRVYQGGSQAATVLSNVFLPRASALNIISVERFTAEIRKVQIAFILIGVFFGLFMAAFPQNIVSILFGADYFPLVELMPFFGLLFFLKFLAGAWGVVLTAAGEQSYRTKLGVIHWVCIMPIAGWLVPMHGSRGWLISLCIGTVLLIFGYSVRGWRYVDKSWDTVGLSVLGGMTFLPFIWVR